jgi:hypothetical protein
VSGDVDVVVDAFAGVASDVGVAADSVVPCQQCGESKQHYPAGPQRVGGDANVVPDAFAGVTYDVGVLLSIPLGRCKAVL